MCNFVSKKVYVKPYKVEYVINQDHNHILDHYWNLKLVLKYIDISFYTIKLSLIDYRRAVL